MVPEGFGRLYPYRVGNLIDRCLSRFEMTLRRQQTLMREPPIRRRPCLCEKVSSEAAGDIVALRASSSTVSGR